ncbi:MAG TPA: efflux RND transporter periplasmic adaptor subunit [Terriglobales bacterium]|jgi:RND family efflux transporter MFP subunit
MRATLLEPLRERFAKLFLLAALSGLITAVSCGGGEAKAGAQGPMQAFPVKVEIAKLAPVHDTTEYVATLKSRDSAVIMPEVDGRVTQISVHSGEHVAAGAPLMQIDPSKQEATVNSQESALAAQQANLEYAKQQYTRTSGLFTAGVVSKQEMDQAKSGLDAAQAQLSSLQAQLKEQQVELHYYRVNAPTNGIVGDIPVRVGDRVTSSTQLTTVDKPGSLEAYIYVPVERAPELKPGLHVQIVDKDGKPLADSRITFISPQVDNTTQTVLAKASIANSNDKLRNAQFIRARIVWGTSNQPLVPVLAVSRLGGQYFAFVAQPKGESYIAHQQPVSVGQMDGNNYVVLDGIKPGDKVIVSGTQFLVEGMPVAPQS